MRSSFLPFSRPSIGDAEVAEVCEALRSGWITSGPRVQTFQEAFAAHVGARHALAVSSATAGFHLVLEALGLGAGDEVITPSLTWPSPANMIHRAGCRPVFADIDRSTWETDPGSVEAAVTPATRAVIPVHFAGQPCDLDPLRELCGRRGLRLIEDAAHAVGTEYRGRPIGAGDSLAVFSFHAIKNLTTGEGGMITSGEEALVERLRSSRFHGIEGDAWKRYAREASHGYDLLEPGWKYNLTDLQAALGIVQLRRIEELNARRAALAALYDRLLAEVPEVIRPARVSYPSRHSWHLYPVLIDPARCGLGRHAFREAMRRRQVGTGLHFLAVHGLSFYRERYPVPPGALPATEFVADRIVSLPLFPDMTDDDVRSVVEAIRDVLAHRG